MQQRMGGLYPDGQQNPAFICRDEPPGGLSGNRSAECTVQRHSEAGYRKRTGKTNHTAVAVQKHDFGLLFQQQTGAGECAARAH